MYITSYSTKSENKKFYAKHLSNFYKIKTFLFLFLLVTLKYQQLNTLKIVFNMLSKTFYLYKAHIYHNSLL